MSVKRGLSIGDVREQNLLLELKWRDPQSRGVMGHKDW